MKLVLKAFQEEAVTTLYSQVADARKRASQGRLEVITLAAPTGAGKTVILTRLIELILQGDEERNPDPNAVFLWLTDQPELNTQTCEKMRGTSDLLISGNALEIGADFDKEVFPPGAVYFLNTQKLGVNASWTRRSDDRTFTLWDTIRNTADSSPGRFFVIIDEAHRGTKLNSQNAAEASSIMQRFVLGSEEIPAVPLVIGISATLDRFTHLLEAAARGKKPRTHQRVDVDPADVIASGLLKRKVILEHPESPLGADFPLLRSAVLVWQDMAKRWSNFCVAQKETQLVRPILLVQVKDGTKTKTSNTDLAAVVKAIREEAGALPSAAFAHAFQEGAPLVLEDGTPVRYLAPSAIDADGEVKVVLFKTSLNTGWDCPRAEVMVSFRTAKDATFIAQLVGRMVRAPLAREIEEDEVLNTVSLALPAFDQNELKKVINRLTDQSGDVPPATVENSRDRFIVQRAVGLDECFELVKSLPTYSIPRKRAVGDVQRLGQLADALVQSGLRENAGEEAREKLTNVLASQYPKRQEKLTYKDVVKPDGTIRVKPFVLDYGTENVKEGETRTVSISEEMVAELYEWARKRLGLDLGLRYWKRRARKDISHDHVLTKLELYAMASDPEILQLLRDEAGILISAWLSQYKQKIGKLPEAQRQAFDEVRQQAGKPMLDYMDLDHRQTLDWSAPSNAPTWHNHLYQDASSQFHEKLNTWETLVLNEEISRPDFIAWLRNRERQPWALAIPYEIGGVIKGCYPDFLIFREVGGETVADIVDPHLVSLEDAPYKAAALARYADAHQDRFGRIDLIIVEREDGDPRVKRLRLMDEGTRRLVMGVTSNQHLRDLFDLKT